MKNEKLFIDVRIPIRKYLKKFVSSHAPVDPFFEIKLTRCHFSAVFIEPLKKNRPQAGTKDKDHLDDELILRMGSSVMREAKFWFSEETIMSIDYRLKSMFDQQLIDHVTMSNKNKGDIKISILEFMNYYSITEDDVSWDALTKMYYRARYSGSKERQEKVQKVVQLALPFN